MYSKALLEKYINERLKQKDWPPKRLADMLGIHQSNYSRSLKNESYNFSIPQLAQIVEILELKPDQVYHVLTGKKEKEAVSQLTISAAEVLVNAFLQGGNGTATQIKNSNKNSNKLKQNDS